MTSQFKLNTNEYDYDIQMLSYIEERQVPNLRKPNLDGYLVWTQADFTNRGFSRVFWEILGENLEVSRLPNTYWQPAQAIVLPDLKDRGLADADVIGQWYDLITKRMSPLQINILTIEINRLITMTANACGVNSVGLLPPPQYLEFQISVEAIRNSTGVVTAKDYNSNEYVQLRLDASTLASYQERAAKVGIQGFICKIPFHSLQPPLLLAHSGLAYDGFSGMGTTPNVIGLATQDNSVQIISMRMTQPPPTKADFYKQVSWTAAAAFGAGAAMYNASTALAAYNASLPVHSPTQDVSYYMRGPTGSRTPTPPPAINQSRVLWTNTPIDVDAPPAKPNTAGPLRLPTTAPAGSSGGTSRTASTNGTHSQSGSLETLSTPKAVPQVLPKPKTAVETPTDTVGSALYRFGSNVPVTMVENLQNPISPIARTRLESPRLKTRALEVSAFAFATPLPWHDHQNEIVILPGADTTEWLDAPGVSRDVFVDPKITGQDEEMDLPIAEIVEGVVGDAPLAIDSEIWLKKRRPYQQQAIESVLDRSAQGKRRHLLIFPTGTGKTFMATETAFELYQLPEYANGRILIIAPTAEIANQNALGMNHRFAGEVGVLHSEKKPQDQAYAEIEFASGQDPKTRVVSTTIQSLAAMNGEFDWAGFTIVLADEAHHYVPDNKTYFAPFVRLGLFDEEGQALQPEGRVLVGFTATPDRMDPRKGNRLVDVYGVDGIADTRDINYFISDKAQEQYLRNPHRIVRVQARDALGRDVLQRKAWLQMSISERALVIAELFIDHPDLNRDGHPKRSILYVTDVSEANALASELLEYGLNVAAVTGADRDRTTKLQAFREGRIDILIGVDVPKEGFDVPGVEAVLLFGDNTESRSQVVQMVGRALRIDPKHPDRKEAYVVDPWGLTERFNIAMSGEELYFQAEKDMRESSESDAETDTVNEKPQMQSLVFEWENVSLGSLIQEQGNRFQTALQSHVADEDAVTRAAYAAGISADKLRRYWLGQSLPATLSEVWELEEQLGVADQQLVLAYQETTGMAIRSHLLQQLQQRFTELGRVPTTDEVGGAYPSTKSYAKYFGSWAEALSAAGLREKLTRELAIEYLQEAAASLSEGEQLSMPKYNTWADQHGRPKCNTIAKAITVNRNDWSGALAAAGLRETQPELTRELTRELAIEYLQEAAASLPEGDQLGLVKYNTWADQHGRPKHASIARAITRNPNDWHGALVAAGLRETQPELTKELAIESLQEAAATLSEGEQLSILKYNTWADQNGRPKCNAIARAITRNPNDWHGALGAAGLRETQPELTKELAIEYLQEAAASLPEGEQLSLVKYNAWADQHGRPKHASIARAITRNPNDWHGALVAAGLREKKPELTVELAIEYLQEAAASLPEGEQLIVLEYNAWADQNGRPKYNAIARAITRNPIDWSGALAAAGLRETQPELTRELAIEYLQEAAASLPEGDRLSRQKYNTWADQHGRPKHTSIARAITGNPKDWSVVLTTAGLK